VVRVIQQARRDAGLDVSDRIELVIGADDAVADAVRAHAAFITGETLAVSMSVVPGPELPAEPQPVGDPHPTGNSADGGAAEIRVQVAKS
jgi:isoleucyl-tRNA synthetase